MSAQCKKISALPLTALVFVLPKLLPSDLAALSQACQSLHDTVQLYVRKRMSDVSGGLEAVAMPCKSDRQDSEASGTPLEHDFARITAACVLCEVVCRNVFCFPMDFVYTATNLLGSGKLPFQGRGCACRSALFCSSLLL